MPRRALLLPDYICAVIKLRLDAYARGPNVLHEAVAPGSRRVRPCAFGERELS